MSNMIKSLCQAVDIIAQQKAKTMGYDTTVEATIFKCIDATIGSYDIQYQGSVFRAYSVNPNTQYNVGDTVLILVPQSNFNNEKTILGAKNKLGIKNINSTGNQSQYISNGYNILSNNSANSINLCSYKTEEKNFDFITKENFQQSLRKSQYLTVSFDIENNLSHEQIGWGNYGIKINLVFKQKGTEKQVIRSYLFDITKMKGDPYYFRTKVNQILTFPIDGVNFVRIESIKGFTKDFFNQDDTKEDDIFITNLSIEGALKLSDSELNGISLNFIAPDGYDFFNQIETLEVNAEVRILGKPVNPKEQTIEYYWFKRNLLITSQSNKYNYLGGVGWQCLNNSLPINTNNTSANKWLTGNNKFISFVEQNNAKNNYYKCVIVYNNEPISKEFVIHNTNANYSIVVEVKNIPYTIKTQTDEYVNIELEGDRGQPNIICHIFENDNQITNFDNFRTSWQRVDANGINKTLYIIQNAENEDIQKQNYKNQQKELKQGLQNGTLVEESPIDSIWGTTVIEALAAIEAYQLSTKPEFVYQNSLYNVHVNEIDNFNTFSFNLLNNSMQGQDDVLAAIEITVSNSDSTGGYYIDLAGADQTFIYDQNGVNVKPAAAPLKCTLLDSAGLEVIDNNIQYLWKVPATRTFITNISQSETIESRLLNPDYRFYEDTDQLQFTIEPTYSSNLTNNNIELIVNYNGYKITKTTNFLFTKEGNTGTNGTGAVLAISAYKAGDKIDPVAEKNANGLYTFNFDELKGTFQNYNTNVNDNILIKWFITNTEIPEQNTLSLNGTVLSQALGTDKDLTNNIVKLEVTDKSLNDFKYYTTLPIKIKQINNSLIKDFYVQDGSGYSQVVYEQDGTRPSYDNTNPFILKVISQNGTEITLADNARIGNDNYTLKYDFEGDSFQRKYSNYYPKNVFYLTPPNNYINDSQINKTIKFICKVNEEDAATLTVPVHFLLNRYGHAALNDWDGNSIDTEKGDIILAPQVGAGRKTLENGFVGVLMGAVQDKENNIKTGLFGYDNGERSIFLDSQTGNATFGKQGAAQIKIDATSNEGTISSHDYSDNKGMKIKFSSTGEGEDLGPYIKFGSGHFSVDSQGNLVAKGGGSIAGWQISDTALTKNNVGMGSNNFDPKNKAFFANDSFYVTHEGKLYSTAGEIAGWVIQPLSLSKDNVGISSDNTQLTNLAFWAGEQYKEPVYDDNGILIEEISKRPFEVNHKGEINAVSGKLADFVIKKGKLYSKGKESFETNKNGVYIGIDGIALGGYDGSSNAFQVDNKGNLKARLGQIANWNISNNALYTGKDYSGEKLGPGRESSLTPNALYFGSAGLALGQNFSINPNGNLYAISGRIGGITLDSGGLHGNNFSISGSGVADFTNVKINGAELKGTLNNSNGTLSGGHVSGAGISGGSFSPSSIRNADNGKQTMNDWATWISEQTFERLRTKELQAGVIYTGTIQAGDFAFNSGIDSLGTELEHIRSWLGNLETRVQNLENKP